MIPEFLMQWDAKFALYDPNFNTRTISHGNQNAFWAEINPDGSFGEPKPVIGNRANTFTPEETALAFYADNIVHYGGYASSTITGEVLFYNEFEPEFAEWALGQVPSANGLIASGGNRRSFVYGFVELIDGNSLSEQDYKLNIYYNCTAGAPEVASVTDEAELTPKEYKIAITASANGKVYNADGRATAYAFIYRNANPTLFDTFMTSVITPSELAISPATGSFGISDTPLTTELSGSYTYLNNDDLLVDGKIEITETSSPLVIIGVIQPISVVANTAWSFSGLTSGTSYTIKMYQGTTLLDTLELTTA